MTEQKFQFTGTAGFDTFLYWILPERAFARRIARKLFGPGGVHEGWDHGKSPFYIQMPRACYRVVYTTDWDVKPEVSFASGGLG